MRRRNLLLAGLIVSLTISHASNIQTLQQTRSKLQISSPAWRSGETIPKQFTCSGANQSPPLSLEWCSAGHQIIGAIGRRSRRAERHFRALGRVRHSARYGWLSQGSSDRVKKASMAPVKSATWDHAHRRARHIIIISGCLRLTRRRSIQEPSRTPMRCARRCRDTSRKALNWLAYSALNEKIRAAHRNEQNLQSRERPGHPRGHRHRSDTTSTSNIGRARRGC